jgi:GNAT superfamily N-acetyltransferase
MAVVDAEMHRVRRAEAPDLDTVVDILTEAARWEEREGLPHPWPIPFPAGRVEPQLAKGNVYLAENAAGDSLGTVTLQWEDAAYWGERPPDAGYVHRLAVRRAFAGRRVGVRILAWAEEETRARSREFLRLDTLVVRSRLHEYYAALGFRRVGVATVGGLDVVLLEKPVAPAER